MSRVLLITEKPGISDNVLKGLSNVVLEGKEVDTVFIYPISWWQWKVPKKTPLRKIPSVPDPKDMSLKLNPTMDVVPYGQISTDGDLSVISRRSAYSISDFRNILIERWSEYDKVICIPEDDRNGWGSLVRWFQWFTEIDESLLIGKDIRCLRPKDFSVEAVEESYGDAFSLNSDYIGEMSRQFEFKHMFDAWYNINSATVFGIAQKKALVENPDIVTKYELMTLHAIKKGQHLRFNRREIIRGMELWCGSGSYKSNVGNEKGNDSKSGFAFLAYENKESGEEAPYEYSNVGIGTHASRGSIVQKLLDKKLIIEQDDESIKLTNTGENLILKCHFGTFDPDLPFRIEKWIKNDDYEGVRRYIRRYFSRQRRFVI